MSSIDLQYRPDDYWDSPDPLSAILTNVKGENRRQMIRDFVAGSASELLGEIDPDLLADTVGDDTRTALTRIHPTWMGGEYLPGYLPGEIEIARIVLTSATQDVISVRARRRRGGTRLLYRVVDEYQDSPATRWICRPQSSLRPLTLGQLVQLIDHAKHEDLNPNGMSLTEYLRDMQEGCEPDELVDFVTVESAFYPAISQYYCAKAQVWLREKGQELGCDDDTDDDDVG